MAAPSRRHGRAFQESDETQQSRYAPAIVGAWLYARWVKGLVHSTQLVAIAVG